METFPKIYVTSYSARLSKGLTIYVDLCNHYSKGGLDMVPEQREALDEIIVKIRAGRITRRTFLERAIAIGLTSSVAGSLLEACGGGGGGSSGPTNVVWQTENDTSGTYPALVDTYNKTNKDNVHVTWHNGPSGTGDILTIYGNTLRARSSSISGMSSDVVYPSVF